MTKEYDIEITITGTYSVEAVNGRDARNELGMALLGKPVEEVLSLLTNIRTNIKGKLILIQRKPPKPPRFKPLRPGNRR